MPFAKTEGGHRRLEPAAVLHFARQSGLSLAHPELLGLLPVSGGRTYGGLPAAREALVKMLATGDEDGCRGLFQDLFAAGHPVLDLCEDLVGSGLTALCEQMGRGKVDGYESRRAWMIASRLLGELRRMIPRPREDAPLALGGGIAGDTDVLTSMLIESVLLDGGWEAESLGAGLPGETLARAVERRRPRIVWLSVSEDAGLVELPRHADSVLRRCEAVGSRLLICGSALSRESAGRILPGAVYFDSLRSLMMAVDAHR